MRVAIDGTQSSGKSTLLTGIRATGLFPGVRMVEEVGSSVAQSKYGIREASDWGRLYGDKDAYRLFFLDVAAVQTDVERTDNFVIDSSLYRLEAYRIFQQMSKTPIVCTDCRYDLILWCCADFGYVSDGFRSTHGRVEIERILEDIISRQHTGKVVILRGNKEDRLKVALSELSKCL